MNRLREAAEALLTGQQTTAADCEEFPGAYDRFVWAAVTSTRQELNELFTMLPQMPYFQLPAPFHVLIARLVGLESLDDIEKREAAANWIALYCDPLEEQAATEGIRRRVS